MKNSWWIDTHRREWSPWGNRFPHNGDSDPAFGQLQLWQQRGRLFDPNDPIDTIFAACGPRWGKEAVCVPIALEGLTRLYAQRISAGLSLVPLVHAWVTAPTSGDFEQVWREFHSATRGLPRRSYDAKGNERLVIFGKSRSDHNAIHIEFKSAWREDNLVGVGLDLDYRTEWAQFTEEADNNLDDRGTSPERAGWRIKNGTPTKHPSNYYRRAFKEAQRGHPRYLFVNAPTWENPLIDDAGLKRMLEIKRRVSDSRWRSNQGAELLFEGVGIPGFNKCLNAVPMYEADERTFIKTYDPAGDGSDWNWISIWTWSDERDGVILQVNMFAYERMEWMNEKRFIRSIMEKWPGEFHFDANGRAKLRGVLEDLAPANEVVEGHMWSGGRSHAKSNLVDAMIRSIGNHTISFIDPDACGDNERLRTLATRQEEEFDEFNLKTLKANSGHDDSVTCAWIAVKCLDDWAVDPYELMGV